MTRLCCWVAACALLLAWFGVARPSACTWSSLPASDAPSRTCVIAIMRIQTRPKLAGGGRFCCFQELQLVCGMGACPIGRPRLFSFRAALFRAMRWSLWHPQSRSEQFAPPVSLSSPRCAPYRRVCAGACQIRSDQIGPYGECCRIDLCEALAAAHGSSSPPRALQRNGHPEGR